MIVEYRDIAIDSSHRYQVGDDGNVRRLLYGDVWRPLLGTVKRNGYIQYRINGKSYAAHRLVAAAFLGPANGRIVRHLNGNPDDCRACNLAYGTNEDNEADKLRHGRRPIGSKVHNAVLDESKVIRIKRMLAAGVRKKVIAAAFGVTSAAIYLISKRKNWAHVMDEGTDGNGQRPQGGRDVR